MKRQIPALLLALLLVIPAGAAGLARNRTYDGAFSDLTPDSPFYSNVTALYEYGLSNGKEDGTFGLEDTITLGQAVIFAGRVRGLYQSGGAEAALAYRHETTPGALAYLRYLQAEGGMDLDLGPKGYMAFYEPATRAQVAHVLNQVLPEEALPVLHQELVDTAWASGRFIPDVKESTPYYQDILDLYRKGVSMGSGDNGAFRPGEPITRGAAAAMITRLADPELRVRPQWDLTKLYSAAGTTLADLVEPGTYSANPANEAELESALRYMLSRGENQITFYRPWVPEAEARQIMNQALSVMKAHCEQGYNEVRCIRETDRMTLRFSAAGAEERTEEYRAAAMEAAIAVHDQMWEAGTVHAGMTEMEKARVYYDWICANCSYDYMAGNSSISHIPYNLFANQSAVCDGYTGAYNLLLKLEGIACSTVIQGDHIWTAATLDGAAYHIDTTWADTGREVNYDYFAMTPQRSQELHSGQSA